MKIKELRSVLLRMARISGGSAEGDKRADALEGLAGVLAEHDAKTVKSFVKQTKNRQNQDRR